MTTSGKEMLRLKKCNSMKDSIALREHDITQMTAIINRVSNTISQMKNQ